jgi:DNA mismatch endonuclease (patch repair protein)
MRSNRRRDTKPELALRRLLHARGLRYRVDAKPIATLNRRADLVFARAKVAVFVDGCYWHGCPDHGTAARTNSEYWAPKIAGNRARDAETNRLLREEGWTVVRIWEHEDPIAAAERVLGIVKDQSSPPT